MKLSKTEEELMQHIWKLKKAFLKDILGEYKDPKPATTTIATLLKRMTDKGFINYEQAGKSRAYYPLVTKADYFGNHFRGLISHFFGDSAANFASFFTKTTDLTKEELEALRNEIDKEIERKKDQS